MRGLLNHIASINRITTEIMTDIIDWKEFSEVEKLKYDSNYLRGTLVESLADPITGAIAPGEYPRCT